MPKQTLLQKGKVKIEKEELAPGKLRITVDGIADEDCDFAVITKSMGPGPATVQFELGGISRINSCGVREWLLMLEKLGADRKIEIESVSQMFIEQSNMIPNMLGKKGTPVKSFQAPYRCTPCDKEVTVNLTPAQVRKPDGGYGAPEMKCPSCGQPLEFDWIEDEYFNFLKRI